MSIGRLFSATAVGLILLFLALPIVVVGVVSFSSATYLTFPPPAFGLNWYAAYFGSADWLRPTWLSIWVAACVVVLSTVLGTLASLGIARLPRPLRVLATGLILSPLIVPVIVIAIGMFSIYVRWKITGTLIGLVIAHSALAIPFVVVSVSTSLRTIDRNLELAAQNLGADPLRTFTRITLPLILPGVLAGFLFAFLTSWDEVVVAIFLTTAKFRTLPVEMWEQVRQVVDPTVAAVATIVLAVTTTVLLLAFVVRRQAPAT